MKIIKVEAIPLQFAENLPGLWDDPNKGEGNESEHVVVKIHSDEGLIGIGESQPTDHGTREETTAHGMVELIRKVTPVLLNKDPYQKAPLFYEMDKVVRGYPWAKAGIDIALFDLIGKALKRPVFELLGGSFRDKLPIEFPLTERKAAPKKLAEEAAKATKQGYAFLELKVGTEPKLDVERVSAVREAVGSKPSLKIDVNAGYPNASVAIRTIKKMEKFDIDFVEQPLVGSDLRGMAKVTEAVDVNILADETAPTLHDLVENVIRKKAADAIHVKVPKGGITAALQMISVAEASEIIPVVGASYAFGIGIAAVHQIAATMTTVRRPDHYGRPYYVDDILKTPIEESNGYATISRKPGLGVELDEAKLETFRTRQKA